MDTSDKRSGEEQVSGLSAADQARFLGKDPDSGRRNALCYDKGGIVSKLLAQNASDISKAVPSLRERRVQPELTVNTQTANRNGKDREAEEDSEDEAQIPRNLTKWLEENSVDPELVDRRQKDMDKDDLAAVNILAEMMATAKWEEDHPSQKPSQ